DRRVDIPELRRPVLEVGSGEDPVLVLDRVPDLAGEAGRPDRRVVPMLAALLLDLLAELRVLFLHPLPAARPGRARILGDELAQGRQGERGIGDDGLVDGLELADVLGPLARTKLHEPDVDDRAAIRDATLLLMGRP